MSDLYIFFSAIVIFLCSANFAVVRTFHLPGGFMEGWRLSIPTLLCCFSCVIYLLVVDFFDDGSLEAEPHRFKLYLFLYALGWFVSALHNRAYMWRRYQHKISIRQALLLNFQIFAWMKLAAIVLWIPFVLIAMPFVLLFGSA